VTLDPEVAAILGACALAGLLALGGFVRRVRDIEHCCRACGRRVVSGIRTCDCDL
jgi:hypothetical protein